MNIISGEPGGEQHQQGWGGGKEKCQHCRISIMSDKAISYREIKGEQRTLILLHASTVCALSLKTFWALFLEWTNYSALILVLILRNLLFFVCLFSWTMRISDALFSPRIRYVRLPWPNLFSLMMLFVWYVLTYRLSSNTSTLYGFFPVKLQR